MIIHIDADAFFASVEQATNPLLKGRPIVTGAERGIVVAMSYPAKALGVKRGMLVSEAKKLSSKILFVPSDYETYGLFSARMFAIIKRFTPAVEEYSIDEAFADLSGLRRLHRGSYQQIATHIKATIESELGITVSVGISLTKSLAKLASKFDKPSGLVCVKDRQLKTFLEHNSIDKVWGFGKNSVALLNKHHIHTVADFVNKPQSFATKLFGKVGTELWQELSGTSVYKVDPKEKTTQASISKFKTFTPSSDNHDYLYAQLLRNLERATAKMRRFKLATKKLVIILRAKHFKDDALEIKLSRPTSSVLDMLEPIRCGFEQTIKKGCFYRATGIVLCNLNPQGKVQLSLFEEPLRMIKTKQVDVAIDKINKTYGRQTIHLASTLLVNDKEKKEKKFLNLPFMQLT